MPNLLSSTVSDLDVTEMFRHYASCALWASHHDDAEDQHFDGLGVDDISVETQAKMISECRSFLEDNAKDVALSGQSLSQTGHDFFLSRCGHGAGFFDRGLGQVGTRLQKAARVWGDVNLYVGEDGQVHQD